MYELPYGILKMMDLTKEIVRGNEKDKMEAAIIYKEFMN